MQMCILEKLIFQMQKTHTLLWGNWIRAFVKSHCALLILLLEATVNFPNCPLCFKRHIMLSAVLSPITRSHLSATMDNVEVNWILILDENCGVTDQHTQRSKTQTHFMSHINHLILCYKPKLYEVVINIDQSIDKI